MHSSFSSGLLACALLLIACGGGDSGSTAQNGGANRIDVLGLDTFDFDADVYRTEPGQITFIYRGQGNVHTFVVEGLEDELRLEVDGIGDRDEGSIELSSGSYVLYCDIPGHREIGMEATLVVG